MKSYDVIGWVECCDVFCTDCGSKRGLEQLSRDPENECAPIFADSEWDCLPTCDNCGAVIEDVRLTADGIAWVREALRNPGSIPKETLIDVLNRHGEEVQ